MSSLEVLELVAQLAMIEARPSSILSWRIYWIDKDTWEQGLDFAQN